MCVCVCVCVCVCARARARACVCMCVHVGKRSNHQALLTIRLHKDVRHQLRRDALFPHIVVSFDQLARSVQRGLGVVIQVPLTSVESAGY